jgi:DNA repair protein RecN (Recombination protein N)
MLRELHISNLAVIADARIELAAGLNCFTGATGAGKSLVIGAIEILLGMRSPAEMLRPGAAEGRVSGLFEVRDSVVQDKISALTDVAVKDDGGELLLTRKLYSSGRTSVSLNGQPITLAMLKGVAEHLVDVHGQHDHQFLLRPGNQLDMLDQFAGNSLLRAEYEAEYRKLADTTRRLEELQTSAELRRQQLDLYRFQLSEIDSAELAAGEFEELTGRSRVLGSVEKIKRDTTATYSALYDADGAVVERLKTVASILAELAEIDGQIKPIATAVRDATVSLEESAFDLSRYLSRLELDPAEIAEVNDRLTIIQRMMSKYGDTVEEVLALRQELAAKVATLERDATDAGSLDKEIAASRKALLATGHKMRLARAAAIKKLCPQVVTALASLGMERAVFSVQMTEASGTLTPSVGTATNDPISPTGLDAIEFMVQPNPGLAPAPLRKIASGGEMSRIMLALKGILSAGHRVSVLVFDEIDSNVGGRLGSVIGSKLRELAAQTQVLCITHLPQIACYADNHLTVRKKVMGGGPSGGMTETDVRAVTGDARLEEIAEMIGGAKITETTKAQARELLETARALPAKPAKITVSVAKTRQHKPVKRR